MKEREHALQSLDLAYHKYREILRNLEEGQKVRLITGNIPMVYADPTTPPPKFYNDFSAILSEFRALCKDFAAARRDEARCVLFIVIHGRLWLSLAVIVTLARWRTGWEN